MANAITIERYVIQCKTNYITRDKDAYITPTGFSVHLTDAKMYDSLKNAKSAVKYWQKHNKFNHDYCIFRVKQSYEITGIINCGLNNESK